MVETKPSAARPSLGRRSLVAGVGALALLPQLGRPALAATSGLVVIGKDGWLFPLWDAMSRYDQAQMRPIMLVLNEAIGAVKSAGIEVVIAMIPSKVRTYRQFLPDDVRFVPDVDRRYPSVMGDLRRPGMVVPDLDTLFRGIRAGQPNQQLYFKTDTHWTPAGAEAAATEVAKRMKEGLRLPPNNRPGTRLGGAASRTNPAGDLSRLLPAADRTKYAGEPYEVRQVAVASGASALLEDDSADVVVVGNSFVEPKYGFQQMLSNQLERPVGLAWRPNNFGAYFTLLDYVKSASFKRQRPKVMVWTHLEFDMQNASNSSSWGQNAMPPQTFLTELKRSLVA